MSASIRQLEDLLARELGRVVIGAHTSVRALTVALVARGHVLVQGVPGLGKTLLAKALACALGGEFKRSEEHTSELQSQSNLVCRLLLEKKKKQNHRCLRVLTPRAHTGSRITERSRPRACERHS